MWLKQITWSLLCSSLRTSSKLTSMWTLLPAICFGRSSSKLKKSTRSSFRISRRSWPKTRRPLQLLRKMPLDKPMLMSTNNTS